MDKLKCLFGIACVVCLVSCSTTQSSSSQEKNTTHSSIVDETFEQKASDATSTSDNDSLPASNDILNSLLPPISFDTPAASETRFDVQADALPLNAFLMGLVDGTDYNMVVDPSLVDPVTLHLKNVTISEVLNLIQHTQDIDVRKQGNIFYVGTSEIQTAVYPLNYLNLKRSGTSRTNVSSGQILQGNSSNQNNQNSSNDNGNNNQQGGSSGDIVTLNSTSIETETEADLWVELQNTLTAIVEQEPGSFVMVSPQTGIVVVKALPKLQRQVAEYLGVAQSNLQRQVILEAKILEVTLNDGFQAGINWQQIYTNGAGNQLTVGNLGQVLQVADSANPLNGIFNLGFQTQDGDPDPFSATIQLLEEQGNVQVLSSPRVSTINNQKAVIKVGTDEFFVTDVSTTTVTGLNNATTPNVTLTPFFSGIALDVTPHISAQGEIILHVHPSVSDIQDQTKVVTVGADEFAFPLALSSVRESDSIVKTRSGDVVVIGGLMQNKIEEVDAGTPGLRSIPILGNLFNQKRQSHKKSELVILLKATVIGLEDWSKQVKEYENRFRSLGQ
ncbi:pilus (MSHA type) biogenesis protein MshL [Pleionea sp. CnH1-48]|uniref:pilus (MSHA type) biogenesis protein MshL n=1 Tax=Pleionea sp. CnH1-48 TaxID=2954494 RepID=UPI0020981561|nr:pilus (MSHA type) biogenesis protein MshL [Pleionea sp. CnH1-48]MCO7226311.1 pilus (MSHA type) biogenesis protein MshL [Pleionea sp. CnH1-48]